MKQLLEAINRGILKGLNENNIELLTDLDDDTLDQMGSIQTKSVNSKISLYKYFPTTTEELAKIINAEVERKGWNCSLNHIDVSQITDMSYLFSNTCYYGYKLGEFNGDISRWNVSNVENTCSMFYGAKSFNQSICDWDVSNVTTMEDMFYGADSFNQPIGRWDVSNVENIVSMFDHAETFNQPIGDWNISNVTDMNYTFYCAEQFDQDLSKWKLKTNCDTTGIFCNCPIKEKYKPDLL